MISDIYFLKEIVGIRAWWTVWHEDLKHKITPQGCMWNRVQHISAPSTHSVTFLGNALQRSAISIDNMQ